MPLSFHLCQPSAKMRERQLLRPFPTNLSPSFASVDRKLETKFDGYLAAKGKRYLVLANAQQVLSAA
ncbi:MAG: hypothetical protein NZ805_09260 [Armatimonadetes bacterium]|nr:hypothetical protein [Armatimonadota bacterium]